MALSVDTSNPEIRAKNEQDGFFKNLREAPGLQKSLELGGGGREAVPVAIKMNALSGMGKGKDPFLGRFGL